MNADVVVIGAGISGLVDAILLADTGRRVLVLEQHTIPGGYLQQFARKGTTFDVGFHYLGSTEEGRPLRTLLEYLGVFGSLELLPFPADAAIEWRAGARRFAFAPRWQRFREDATRAFPGERDAIAALCDEIDAVCRGYRWFDLRRDGAYVHPLELPFFAGSFAEHIAGRIADPWLTEVLGSQAFNLGLLPHEIPWTKWALAFRSNFDTTSRLERGGAGLVDALVARGRALGVEYRFAQDVVAAACSGRRMTSVSTAAGDVYEAALFVAACHPKVMLRCLRDEDVGPEYKKRVLSLRDSRGALQVFVRLDAPLRSLGATCLLLADDDDGADTPGAADRPSRADTSGAGDANGEHARDVRLGPVLVTHATAAESSARGGPRLEAMAYVDDAPFARWRGTPVHRRGPEYEALKSALTARLLARVTHAVPELSSLARDTYAATPLTDAHYTRAEHGAVFGISHDVTQQGTNRPLPRLFLKNLWFTGHSLALPGICGTIINAFDVCAQMRDDDLFARVAR